MYTMAMPVPLPQRHAGCPGIAPPAASCGSPWPKNCRACWPAPLTAFRCACFGSSPLSSGVGHGKQRRGRLAAGQPVRSGDRDRLGAVAGRRGPDRAATQEARQEGRVRIRAPITPPQPSRLIIPHPSIASEPGCPTIGAWDGSVLCPTGDCSARMPCTHAGCAVLLPHPAAFLPACCARAWLRVYLPALWGQRPGP